MPTKKSPSSSPISPAQAAPHHRVRTFFAALCGTLALSLVLATVLAVWLDRTLTDTAIFTATVDPLVEQPAVQAFVTQKAADGLLESAPITDLATSLLPAGQADGKSAADLTTLVRPVLADSVSQVVTSAKFAELWRSTTQSAHEQLISQLRSDSSELALDLGPAVTGVIDQLKVTKLAPIADKIELKPESARLNLGGGVIAKAHTYYHLLQASTLLLVVVTILLTALSVAISVHHTKTLRRILMGTGINAIILAGLIALTGVLQLPMPDPATREAVGAVAGTLLHGLQLACLVLAGVCLAGAIGSKVYEHKKA